MASYQQRIQDIRQRIRQNPGNDSRLRNRLQRVQQQRPSNNRPNPTRRPPPQQQQTPLPWDSGYETSVGQLRRDRDFQHQNLAAEEANIKRAYGFEDPSDPFSMARNLQRDYEANQRGTMNNYAAQGQLYAGSLNNAKAIDRRNYDQSYDAAQKDYQSQLREILMARTQADRDYYEGTVSAQADRLSNALTERVDPAEAPPNRRQPQRNPRRRPQQRNRRR